MTRSPKVSVVTCVYNGERFLKPAIESILGQTLGDFEYWFVDDSSTDGSQEIIASYASDRRVRLLSTERNVGAYAAANLALRKATGEYVARMDADDLSHPERLETQVEFLDRHPEAGLLGTGYQLIDAQDTPIAPPATVMTQCGELRWGLLFRNCIGHSTVMYRRGVAQSLGYYGEERYVQDYDLWSRISFVSEVRQVPDPLVLYRITETSLSATQSAAQRVMERNVVTRAIARLLERPPEDPEIAEFVRWRYGFDGGRPPRPSFVKRFVSALFETLCARFGYVGAERARVRACADETLYQLVRSHETTAPAEALSMYLGLIQTTGHAKSCLRLLPALAKLAIGRRGVWLARGVRNRIRRVP